MIKCVKKKKDVGIDNGRGKGREERIKTNSERQSGRGKARLINRPRHGQEINPRLYTEKGHGVGSLVSPLRCLQTCGDCPEHSPSLGGLLIMCVAMWSVSCFFFVWEQISSVLKRIVCLLLFQMTGSVRSIDSLVLFFIRGLPNMEIRYDLTR